MKRFYPSATDMSRRRFVQAVALGGAATSLGLWRPANARAMQTAVYPTELAGSDFALEIGQTPVNYTGAARVATTVNGGTPGPLLRWKEGSDIAIRVTNRLSVPTSIHWHGILLPAPMDGVPGISFSGIAPGETFVYRFPVKQSGTYWYHSHSGYQEQTGLYGALVIDPIGDDPIKADRDYVVMLTDWTDDDPASIYAKLKKQSDYYNVAEPTAADFFRDVRENGMRAAMARRRMWNQMRMNPTDLADVTGYTYTYLMNGNAPATPWTGLFRPGEKIRLRIINASSMTIFDLRIPGLRMTVVSADGQNVAPVEVDECRISVAETYDVIVQPQDDRAFTIFAQSIDRSGYACGTLTSRPGMRAAIPKMDARVSLSMGDVMGDMHSMPAQEAMTSMQGMVMDHAASAQESSPGVDMRVDTPHTRLDDPGVGLRDNGRRVLTYADLRTLGGTIDTREPVRDIELHLTGNMMRYMWSFDGVKFSDAASIAFHAGERLRIVLINDTMMNHPIHLHGMWSELENADGTFQVRKHTINVQPGQRIAYRVTADAPGRWAYHCHMLYHMEAGMFREVVVA